LKTDFRSKSLSKRKASTDQKTKKTPKANNENKLNKHLSMTQLKEKMATKLGTTMKDKKNSKSVKKIGKKGVQFEEFETK
jgi:hypothetical protein